MKKRLVSLIVIAASLAVTTPAVAQEEHAAELVVAFDSAVLMFNSYPSPEEMEPAIRGLVCDVLESAIDDSNRWVHAEAAAIADEYFHRMHGDAVESHEGFQTYVEAEVDAFKKLHPAISEQTLVWLRSMLWSRWWHNAIEPEDLQTDLVEAAAGYHSKICEPWETHRRRVIWKRVRGALYFLGGASLAAVDVTPLIPDPILSGYSVHVAAGAIGYGIKELTEEVPLTPDYSPSSAKVG